MKTKTLQLLLLTLFLIVSISAQMDDPDIARLQQTVNIISKVNALPIEVKLASPQFSSAATASANLQMQAGLLNQLPAGTIVEIGVHTNPVGNEAANIELTGTRANIIKSELIKLGVNAASLKAKGYGSSAATEANKLKNRRVEYLVVKMPKNASAAVSTNASVNSENSIIPGKGWKKVVLGANQDAFLGQLFAPENTLQLPPQAGKPTYLFLNYYSAGINVTLTDNIVTLISFDLDYVKSNPKIKPFAGKTDKGIGAGAKVDDVIKAHGGTDKIETKTLSNGEVRTFVRYPKTTFALIGDRSSGKLVSISLSSQ